MPKKAKPLGQVVYEAIYPGSAWLSWDRLLANQRMMFQRGAHAVIAEWQSRQQPLVLDEPPSVRSEATGE
jgi:hypothetical protein